MTEVYRASFSNGTVITSRRVSLRVFHYAWLATGYHRLSNQPWSYHGFSGTRFQAEERMERMTGFAQPDRIGFEEIVEVELIWVGEKRGRKPSKVSVTPNPDQQA